MVLINKSKMATNVKKRSRVTLTMILKVKVTRMTRIAILMTLSKMVNHKYEER